MHTHHTSETEAGGGADTASAGVQQHPHTLMRTMCVIICLVSSVFAGTLNVFHAASPSTATAAALTVLGSIDTDIQALLFVLLGASFTESTLPALSKLLQQVTILSFTAVVPWAVLLATLSPSTVIYWVHIALSPICLSPFFEFREKPGFRPVSETAWIMQTCALLQVLGAHIRAVCNCTAKSMTVSRYKLAIASTWAFGFAHVYIALKHPHLAVTAVRSPLTTLAFFTQGTMVYLSQEYDTLAHVIKEMLDSPRLFVPMNTKCDLVYIITACMFVGFYAHHADTAIAENLQSPLCYKNMGASPCLWTVDACNFRFLPFSVMVAYLLMQADHMLHTDLEHMDRYSQAVFKALQTIESLWDMCPTFLIFSELFAILLHWPLARFLPSFVAAYSNVLIVFEIALVFFLCYQWHKTALPCLMMVFSSIPLLKSLLDTVSSSVLAVSRQEQSATQQQQTELSTITTGKLPTLHEDQESMT